MDKEKLKEILEKLKDMFEKTKQIVKEKSIQAIEYAKKNYPLLKDKTKQYSKVVVHYTKNGYALLKNKTNSLVKYTKENYPLLKEKTIKLIVILKQKSILLYNELKANPKQAITAGVILFIAILLLIVGISTNSPKEKIVIPDVSIKDIKSVDTVDLAKAAKPKNVIFNFTATTTKPIVFEIFYTLKREVWFDKDHSILIEGKKGTKEYSVVLPSDKIYRIRLDFGSNPGKVTVKNMYLSGTQEFDLNNYARYELNQLENVIIAKENSSISFVSSGRDPYMAYRPRLIR